MLALLRECSNDWQRRVDSTQAFLKRQDRTLLEVLSAFERISPKARPMGARFFGSRLLTLIELPPSAPRIDWILSQSVNQSPMIMAVRNRARDMRQEYTFGIIANRGSCGLHHQQIIGTIANDQGVIDMYSKLRTGFN